MLDFVENPDLQFLPRFSAGKKPTKYFSDHLAEGADNPFLAVNGGFFVMTAPPRSYCLLVSDGVVNSRPDPYEWTGPSSSPYQFFPVRGAMGRMADGKFETAWVYCVADDAQRPYAFPSPLDNDERIPSFMPSAPTSKTPGAELWEPQQAIGAGPMLVRDSLNVAEDSYYREVLHYMGRGSTAGRRPRTALGTTRSQRRMVVVVCNGDQGAVERRNHASRAGRPVPAIRMRDGREPRRRRFLGLRGTRGDPAERIAGGADHADGGDFRREEVIVNLKTMQ